MRRRSSIGFSKTAAGLKTTSEKVKGATDSNRKVVVFAAASSLLSLRAIVAPPAMAVDPIEEWLGNRLKKAYPVEDWVLEGVTGALLLLDDRGDAIDTIDNFLGTSSETIGTNAAIVDALFRRKGLGTREASADDARDEATTHSEGKQPQQQQQVTQPGRRGTRGSGSSVGGASETEKTKSDGDDDASKNSASDADADANPRAPCTSSPPPPLKPSDLQRAVVNCLRCGKIFHVQPSVDGLLSGETRTFLEKGCRCTFCGAAVRATLANGSEINTDSADPVRTGDAFGTGSVDTHREAHQAVEAKATEAKNRLVEFDRTSAKRTTVIDDQADWFALDSNAWLDEKERQEMRDGEIAKLEAEERFRRHRVSRVRVDLLGRRVETADDDGNDSTTAGFMLRESSRESLRGGNSTGLVARGVGNVSVASRGSGGSIPDRGGSSQTAPPVASDTDPFQITKNPTVAFAPRFQSANASSSTKGKRKDTKQDTQRGKPSLAVHDKNEQTRSRVQDESPFETVFREATED